MTNFPRILRTFLVVLVALVEGCGSENENIRPNSDAGAAAIPDANAAANADARTDTQSEFANFKDPGKGEWELGTPETCKMDPTRFNKSVIPDFILGYAVFRYGKLCHKEGDDVARYMMSTTTTLGGIMVGRASYLARDIPRNGPGTGPIMLTDLGTDWIATPTYSNQDASINHIMAMVAAASPSIAEGDLRFEYDMYGDFAINDLITATEKCISQIPDLPKDAESFV